MTGPDPIPELCKHFDMAECTEECHEKASLFDEWLRGKLQLEKDNAHPDSKTSADD